MTGGPILYRWDGETMTPATQRFAREADKQFVVGEEYPLIVHEHRSAASHRHYFAAIYDAWESLPETMAGEFPTPEHLRKRALIMAGYRDERTIVASSKAEARRLAAFIKPMDDYALVSVKDNVVIVFTAKGQSLRAMDKAEFQQSKEAVLQVLGDMLSVSPADLIKTSERAA